jgi:type IV pilus assembly protein PilX
MTRTHQSGISLIVSLVILAVLAMLGVSSFRTVSMQERMGAAIHDRNIALQSAESALREAEALARTNPTPPMNGCVAGLCATPVAGVVPPAVEPAVERWMDSNFKGWRDAAKLGNPTTATAQFFVEYMGEHPTVFACDQQIPPEPTCMRAILRATARLDQSAGTRASVMLQSNVRP